jgi:hypothetical protein
MDEEWFRAGMTFGALAEVADLAGALLGAGLDGLIFNVWPAGDVDAVALAGEALSPLFS